MWEIAYKYNSLLRMPARLLSSHSYTLCSATDTRLSNKMTSLGNNGPKHIKLEITIYDAMPGVKDAITQEDTHIRKTLHAYIQVDKDGNLVRVCDGDQYRKFFQAYLVGAEFKYRLRVKDVSIPLVSLRVLLANTRRTLE